MNKEKQETLIKLLEKTIEDTNKMFSEKEKSHAYIVGVLQGTIIATIESLKH